MDNSIATFPAHHAENEASFWLALLVGICALVGMLFLLKKKTGSHNYNMLGAMLLFFVCTISAGTVFFSWLTMRKIGPVSIDASSITTPYGKLPFDRISNIYIKEEQQKSLLQPEGGGQSTRLLVLESKDGKAHVLSAQNYNIQAILGKLKESLDK